MILQRRQDNAALLKGCLDRHCCGQLCCHAATGIAAASFAATGFDAAADIALRCNFAAKLCCAATMMLMAHRSGSHNLWQPLTDYYLPLRRNKPFQINFTKGHI
eukprot:gene12165-biopygen2708